MRDGTQYWFAQDISRTVWRFRLRPAANASAEFLGRSRIPTQLFLANFEAFVPPDASPLTHPVCLPDARLLYVSKEGDLVLRKGKVPANLRRRKLGLLPDARLALNDDASLVAFYAGATDKRLRHGVLGDFLEGSVLKVVSTRDLRDHATVHIPSNAVFEGQGPMWADVDGDGDAEIVSTVSNSIVGAAVYVAHSNGSVMARTAPVGRGGRWRHQLAVAAFARPNSVKPEIAALLTPHLNPRLQLFRLGEEGLELESRKAGYSTHRLGSRNLDMAVAADANGDLVPEIILPTKDMRRIVALQRRRDSEELVEAWSFWLGDELTSNVALVPLRQRDFAMGLGLKRGRVKLFLPERKEGL